MAVRNLDAINRYGDMVAQEKVNARKLREDTFWNCVNTILKSEKDAIDAIDTINFLYEKGLEKVYKTWEGSQPIRFGSSQNAFYSGNILENTRVFYKPSEKTIHFAWGAHGGVEHYKSSSDYDVERIIDGRTENYDEKLKLLATNLQPFLDAFFKWVENL